MRGLSSNGSTGSRSQSTCSFCKSPDHQVGKCPHVLPIKKSLDKGIIPLKYMASVENNDTSGHGSTWRQNSAYWRSPLSGWYSQGENWGDLYKQTEKAYAKWERAQARAKNKSKKTGKRTQKCGYCGGDHTRRTCGLLASHKTKLAKANRNFRKWFYENFVEGQGLSTGAIVDIDCYQEGGYNVTARRATIRTLVTEINWDTINLFAIKEDAQVSWNTVQNWQGADLNCTTEKLDNIQAFIGSGAYLKVQKGVFESKDIQCGTGGWRTNAQDFRAVALPLLPTLTKHIATWDTKQRYYNSARIDGVSVVSRAPQVLADDWIDGYSDEMSVIFKKFSHAQLDFLGIIDHIKEWADKE